MMAERPAPHANREAGRFDALHVDVRRNRVPRLMDGNGACLFLDVLDANGGAGLDRRHRVDDVVPAERVAAVEMGKGQRHGRDLLDHRRRVAVGDARELVASRREVKFRIVGDLAQVEVEDVEPVVGRGRAEPDVPTHASRSRQSRVERVHRDVGRTNEEDLLGARPGFRHAELPSLEPRRHHVGHVEERVDPVSPEPAPERGSPMPSITTSSWFSASCPPPPIPGIMKFNAELPFSASTGVEGIGRDARSANRRSRHSRVSRMRSSDGLMAPIGP